LRKIRSMFYELLTKGITADLIFQNLVREFLKGPTQKGSVPETIKPQVMKFAVLFEGRCIERAKSIIHLEAFIARTMALIRQNAQKGGRGY
jgi:replication factor C subunit 3/5